MTELTLAICMYNAERYIERTLASVLGQTMRDFYLLIVDDCSTDGSVAAVEFFFSNHPRQHELVSLPVNGGVGHARHFAERHASTKYLMFLDADDLLYPEAAEKMFGKIKSDPDLMAVGCYLAYIDKDGKRIGGGLYLGEITKEGFYEKAAQAKLIFMQPTAIYDRELALSVGGYVIDGYPEGRPRYQDYCEDLDLWTRMSDLYTEGKAIVVIPEVLCGYRKADGLSSSSFNMVLKMRYTKFNIGLRRAGGKDRTFIEFYSSLAERDLNEIRRDSNAADNLRNGMFCLKEGKIFKGLKLIVKSIVGKPSYIIDKVRHNFLK